MIRVEVRSYGEVLESSRADPDFDPVLSGVDRTAYPILGHLDPYGDTYLNSMQVTTLKGEIARAGDRLVPARFAGDLLALCELCLADSHRFMRFIGD
ncbi:hypothetical protein [Amycolatopsis sp. FDAARGOS 1241]|uniref:hypothetical protein n=1 Tax=Amycolatopsis sp. FDAARGOS 1241 TaxID=2778070 RepID=UPI0019520229|nr:hypothetical protein [Amycolatopsis sp. FDAARGOS 1241]QRP42791.1 hypothetical protein I6J71_25300 [Amycolatopsis sp. FDAARGOS 1241]